MTELDIRADAAKRAYLLNKHKMHVTAEGKLDELAVWRIAVQAAMDATVRPWKKDYVEPTKCRERIIDTGTPPV